MRYEVSQEGDSTVLRIDEARFDAKLATEFRALIESIMSELSTHLVVDIGAVKFMDSSGLGAVMGVYKLLRDKKISIARPQKPVQDLFKLTRMDRLIKTFDSVESALTTVA